MTDGAISYGWGLVGPGRFAREFAEALGNAERARPVAVSSRDGAKAKAFAAEFGFERGYDDFKSLLADTEIDIVYLVVPHVYHRTLAEEAIRAGKAVLCEKPLTPSAEETKALTSFAAERGGFLMEAMKTGFLPAVKKAKEWIEEGKIGEPRLGKADFCFRGPLDPRDRLMNPSLAGGAVLDVGIYPLYLTRHLLGEVKSLYSTGSLAETGVEDSAAILANHESGASSVMTCSFRTEEAMDAVVSGTEGEIHLPVFHAATSVTLKRNGEVVERYADDTGGGMLGPEIEAVMAALDKGLTECPGHRHADTIRISEIMDEVRGLLGATARV